MTKNLVSEIYVKEEENANSMRHDIDNDIINSNYGEQQKHKQHSQHQKNHHQQIPVSKQYNVNLQYHPITPEARKETKLILSVTEQKSGDPIRDFELVHDKIMHLIIVSEDLSYFAHIHPTFEENGESFTIVHSFPESGRYKY
jgi:hypothetical protein